MGNAMGGLSPVAEKEGASNPATRQYQMSVDAAQSYSQFVCLSFEGD
jgi:hypothetical protein